MQSLIDGRVRPETNRKDKSAILGTPDPTLKCHSVILLVTQGMRYMEDELKEQLQIVMQTGIVRRFHFKV